MAVTALSSVKSGPPKAPACWPVTTATVRLSASSSCRDRAAGGAPRRSCCAAMMAAIAACGRAMPRAARDRIAPRLRVGRVAGVERRNLGEVEGVVRRRAAGSSQSGARRSPCGSSRRRTSVLRLSPARTLSEPCESCQDDHQAPVRRISRCRGFRVQENRAKFLIRASMGYRGFDPERLARGQGAPN